MLLVLGAGVLVVVPQTNSFMKTETQDDDDDDENVLIP